MPHLEPLILPFRHGPFRNVSYVVACPETREAFAIDPAWDTDAMLAALAVESLELTKIVLSHCHHDHVHGVRDMVAVTGARVYAHELEPPAELRKTFSGPLIEVVAGDLLALGRLRVQLLHTPGHTAGSLSALVGGHIFAGDTMMVAGMGRPGPGLEPVAAMWESVTGVFQELDGEVVVHPGHDSGPAATATMAEQRARIPALRTATFDEFIDAMERETGRIIRE